MVTNYEIDDFATNLKSGEVLCDLVNELRPNTVLKIHRGENLRPAQARVLPFFRTFKMFAFFFAFNIYLGKFEQFSQGSTVIWSH